MQSNPNKRDRFTLLFSVIRKRINMHHKYYGYILQRKNIFFHNILRRHLATRLSLQKFLLMIQVKVQLRTTYFLNKHNAYVHLRYFYDKQKKLQIDYFIVHFHIFACKLTGLTGSDAPVQCCRQPWAYLLCSL